MSKAQEALAAAADEFATREGAALDGLIDVKSSVEARFKVGMTFEQYTALLGVLGGRSKMLPWIIGDALVYGEKTFGEQYAQAIEATGLAKGTLLQYAWVAKNIPPARRVEGVDFSIHRLVGKYEAKVQSKYLTLARRDGLNTRQVREQMIADGIIEDRPKKSSVEKFQAVWSKASQRAREEIAGLIDEWRRESVAKAAKAGKKAGPKLRGVSGGRKAKKAKK